MAGITSYAAGKYGFELDGVDCGYLASVGGGEMSAEVITEAASFTHVKMKHLGAPKIAEIQCGVGGVQSAKLVQWIKDTLSFNPTKHSGRIVALDQGMKTMWEKEFHDALISSIQFPKYDAQAKEPVLVQVGIQPRDVVDKKSDGKLWSKPQPKEQRQMVGYMFRASFDGLDCSKIKSISEVKMKQKCVFDDVGETRQGDLIAGGCDFDDPISIVMSSAAAGDWYEWHKRLVKDGLDHAGPGLKSGQIEALDPSGKKTLFTIKLHEVGITKISKNKFDPKSDSVNTTTVELFCHSFELMPGEGVV